MTEALQTIIGTAERDERRNVLRSLLLSPLITKQQRPDLFKLILKHKDFVSNWYMRNLGWSLSVFPQDGFARLFKVSSKPDSSRGALTERNSTVFNVRRYVLMCISLAVIDNFGIQFTLNNLASKVIKLSAESDIIKTFDPTRRSERSALVDGLKWLINVGVLFAWEQHHKEYKVSGEGDALYEVNNRVLGQLIVTSKHPSLATDRDELEVENYPETEEGKDLAMKHAVMRRLAEDPVLYYEELGEDELEWLSRKRRMVSKLLSEDLGLAVESRKEGIAAIDPDGTLTDNRFPHGFSTLKHASLLLCEHLSSLVKEKETHVREFAMEDVVIIVESMIDDYGKLCGWKQGYLTGDAQVLTYDIVEFLCGFRLARVEDNSLIPLPAMARFAPEPV